MELEHRYASINQEKETEVKKKLIVCLGLAVLATPAFAKLPYIEPTPSKPIEPPKDNDFIQNKMKRIRRKK